MSPARPSRCVRTLLAITCLLLAGCTSIPPPPPAEATDRPLAIVDRFACTMSLGDAVDIVVRNASAWRALWERLCSGVTPPPPLPNVNFATHMVVVSTWGTKSTGGHEVDIRGAHDVGPEISVGVIRTAPGPGCATTQSFTHPGAMAIVERMDKPVRFVHEDLVQDCGAPGDTPRSPWNFTFDPPLIRGAEALPARFTVHAAPNASAPPGQLLPSPWMKLDGSDRAINLTAAGGTWQGEVLVGAVDRVRLTVTFERADLAADDPERPSGYAAIEGPLVQATADPNQLAIPVRSTPRSDLADAPEGMNVTAQGRNVTVVFSLGSFHGIDCMEQLQLLGNATAWRGADANTTMLRAAIATSSSDACIADAPPRTPRLVLDAGPFATRDVAVVVDRFHSCFCVPRGGWEELTQRVTLD